MTFQEVVIHFECYSLLLLLWNFSTLSRHLFQLLYQNPVTKKITNGFWRGEGQGVGAAKVRKIGSIIFRVDGNFPTTLF